MYLSTLKINNFKNLIDRTFNFGKINLIVGDNGMGKTSLLEAIVFLTTNHFEGKMADYINWDHNQFILQSQLSHLDSSFYYEIEVSNSAKRKLKNLNTSEEWFQSDAVKVLSDIVDPTLALYSNISLQGKSTQLLFENPAPRLEKLKQLFRIDRIDDAINKLDEDLSEIKTSISSIESELSVLRNLTFNYEDEIEVSEDTELKTEVMELQSQYATYLTASKDYEIYLEKLRSYEAEVNRLQNIRKQLTQYEDELKTHSEKKFKYDSDTFISLKKEITVKIAQLHTQQGVDKKNQQRVSELNIHLKNLNDKLSAIEITRIAPLTITEENLQDARNALERVVGDFSVYSNKLKAIESGKCPECGAEYDSTEINELKIKVTQLSMEKKELQDKVNDWAAKIQDYKDKVNANLLKKQSRENIVEQINNLTSELNTTVLSDLDFDSEISSLKKEYDIIETEHKDFLQTQTQIEKLNSLIVQVKVSLNPTFSKPDEVVAPAEFDLQLFEQKKEQLQKNREQEILAKKIIENNEREAQREKENTKKISEREEHIQEQKNQLALLNTSKKILSKDFSSYLIDNGTEFIKNKMNDIFQKSYGKYNVTLAKEGKGVEFFYSVPDKPLSSVNVASGYEKQALSVSFRIALSTLHNFGIFLFDEIDSDSSEENSVKLFETILQQKFNQLFIITHKELTKEYLSSIPYCNIIEV